MQTQQNSEVLPPKSGSVLWVTAIVLTRRGYGEMTISQTLSWKNECTEDEAKGAAVSYALKEKPGFSVDMVTTARIELPSQNNQAEQPWARRT